MSDQPSRPIPQSEWLWCGYGGHFIGWRSCRFHMHTRVGDFRISTVGDYWPAKATDGPEPLGFGPESLFETMVFPVAGHGTHGEGEFAGDELECERYATAEEACTAHAAMCLRYAGLDSGS